MSDPDTQMFEEQAMEAGAEQVEEAGGGFPRPPRGLILAAELPPVPDWARRPPSVGGQEGLFDELEEA